MPFRSFRSRPHFWGHSVLVGIFVGIFAVNFWLFNRLHDFTWSDVEYYADFAAQAPLLYSDATFGHYSVLYLPHFFLFAWPFTGMTERTGYLIMTGLNFGAVIAMVWHADPWQRPFDRWVLLGLGATLFSLARWGNFEILVLWISLRVYERVHATGRLSWGSALWFSLFAFKLLNLAFVPLMLLAIPSGSSRKRAILHLVVWLLVLELPYVVLNWWLTPAFWTELHTIAAEVFSHRHPALQPLLLVFRISFSLPVLYLGFLGIRHFYSHIVLPFLADLKDKECTPNKKVEKEDNPSVTALATESDAS